MKRGGPLLALIAWVPWLAVGCGTTEVVVGEAQGVARVVVGVLGATHELQFPDVADSGPATAQAIGSPGGIVASEDGSFFFADRFRRRIGAVTADGQLTWPIGRGACGSSFSPGVTPANLCLRHPDDILRNEDGTLLVADRDAHRVYRVDLAADEVESFLGTGAAGAAADGSEAATSPTEYPSSLALGPDGSVYVAEQGNQRVVRVRGDGIVEAVAGVADSAGDDGDGGPAVSAHFRNPSGIAWMGDTLFIADGGANRIRRVVNDTVYAFAGLGAPGFVGDRGAAAAALFRDPGPLVVIGSLLLVADRGNFRVRIIQVGPDSIDTFAGTGEASPGADELDVGRTAIAGPAGLAAAGRAVFLSDSGGYVVRRVIR
jgi:hypothetical protein